MLSCAGSTISSREVKVIDKTTRYDFLSGHMLKFECCIACMRQLLQRWFCADERCDDKATVVRLESLLARRTAELAAEKHRVAPLLAEKETLLAEKDAEIASLKADLAAMTAENDNLRQENQRVRETSHLESQRGGLDILQEVRAGLGELQAALREQ
ncbi:hypothetical protein ABVT39_020188 [Epinephelus coioides]